MKTRWLIRAFVLIVCIAPAYFPLSIPQAEADTPLKTQMDLSVLAKASPDECYYGIGDPLNGPCDNPNKVNQAYVWGLTTANGALWFGTIANTHCLVLGGLGLTVPHDTDSWACEFGSSVFVPSVPLPDSMGDFRPPKIHTLDILSNTLTDKTPVSGPAADLIASTAGLRSAGSLKNLVLLAGPSLVSGINIFAFNARTGQLIEAQNLSAYSDIRIWIKHKNVLYVGVRKSSGGGSVLKWTGTVANPFQFEEVANLDAEAAYLAVHQNRIFVTTWPEFGINVASVWMSPRIRGKGLTPADSGNWTQVWTANNYEPDPVVAGTYGGGAIASFGNYLYWGTMHVPTVAQMAILNTYTVTNPMDAIIAGQRAVSVFRGRFDVPSGQFMTELLYGDAQLLAYNGEGGFELTPNNMGTSARFGSSGIDNPFNTYVWAMEVYEGRLFIGTFDWGYLLMEGLPLFNELVPGLINPDVLALLLSQFGYRLPNTYGADLFRTGDGNSPFVAESMDGLENQMNYGVRTMLSTRSGLFIGTANPMNLSPQGGWELIKLTHPLTP